MFKLVLKKAEGPEIKLPAFTGSSKIQESSRKTSTSALLTHWKRSWCWERLKVGGEGDDGGWDGWMASLTRWTWVWVSSRSWWWTGNPGVLQSLGLQRVRMIEQLNWTEAVNTPFLPFLPFVYVCVFIFIHHSCYHSKYYVVCFISVFPHQRASFMEAGIRDFVQAVCSGSILFSRIKETFDVWIIQFSSVTQSYPTLCDPMDCSMPVFPVHHQLPELAQTHVHQGGDE